MLRTQNGCLSCITRSANLAAVVPFDRQRILLGFVHVSFFRGLVPGVELFRFDKRTQIQQSA